jgi:hypothetical protein
MPRASSYEASYRSTTVRKILTHIITERQQHIASSNKVVEISQWENTISTFKNKEKRKGYKNKKNVLRSNVVVMRKS